MGHDWEDSERHPGYLACIVLALLPIVGILLWPVTYSGLSSLPWALLMIAIVVLPLFSCGFGVRVRPLFQSHYHGEPFKDEVMDISDDEKRH
ncbi:MAG: hypothetical protein ACXADO_03810 [Candidatus Thorarchaeota archaeon]|jgi:hypothetical protein